MRRTKSQAIISIQKISPTKYILSCINIITTAQFIIIPTKLMIFYPYFYCNSNTYQMKKELTHFAQTPFFYVTFHISF